MLYLAASRSTYHAPALWRVRAYLVLGLARPTINLIVNFFKIKFI